MYRMGIPAPAPHGSPSAHPHCCAPDSPSLLALEAPASHHAQLRQKALVIGTVELLKDNFAGSS